jgi:hypothetical protein
MYPPPSDNFSQGWSTDFPNSYTVSTLASERCTQMTVRREVLFIFICLIGIPILRKLSWGLYRSVLHKASGLIGILLPVAWGTGIAFGFRSLVLWLQVGLVLKILGYCAAAYVSAPNYGYTSETTVPNGAQRRQWEMPQLAFLTFVTVSIIVAYAIK